MQLALRRALPVPDTSIANITMATILLISLLEGFASYLKGLWKENVSSPYHFCTIGSLTS